MANRFTLLNGRFEEIESEVNTRLNLAVDDINRLAQSIADVNDRIALSGAGGALPNDLMDERDRLVLALSEQVSVTTTMQEDGAMNVFIGSGQALVTGTRVQTLSVRGSEFDPTRLNVTYDGASGSTPLDTALTGGALGGLLEFRSRMLDPARQSLGQTAVAFVQQFNQQHASGMDLNGELGGDFFAIDPPSTHYSAGNTGSPAVTATVADLSSYTGANYVLEFDGAAYSLIPRRQSGRDSAER